LIFSQSAANLIPI